MLALYLSQHQNLAGDYPVRLVDSTPSQAPGADPCRPPQHVRQLIKQS